MKTPRDLAAQLKGLSSITESIRKTSGTPGLAVGVIENGVIVYEDFFGLRDVEAQLKLDRDTIFYIASITKSMTAASLGFLVNEGKLEWNTPVHEILTQMSKKTPHHANKLTVVDFLSHLTGVAWMDALYLQSNSNILLPKDQSIATFDYLPIVAPQRTKFMYNNYGYNVAGLVIEKLAAQNWGEYVEQRIFRSLGMTRSYTGQPDDPNVAVPYNILQDHTPFRIPFSETSEKTMMFAGQSVRSSLGDLLKYCNAWLSAISDLGNIPAEPEVQAKNRRASPVRLTKNHIVEVVELLRPRIAIPSSAQSINENTYAMGWNRTQLPGMLDFGWNARMVANPPVIGNNSKSELAIWHGGNMPGTSAAVCMLPRLGIAVVVLQNSLGLCDAADWVCQLIIDTIVSGKSRHDFVAFAKEAAQNGQKRMEKVQEYLDKKQVLGTKHRNLEDYVGSYWNSIRNWVIEVAIDDTGSLFLKLQGREDERFQLRHYHYDTFVWNLSYDETVKRAQYCRHAEYYMMEFVQGDGHIRSIRWRHDASLADGEIFLKD